MWKTANTLSLIEDLRSNPCLWDVSSKDYRLRDKKRDVYEELATKYGTNASEIEKKVHSLKSQFRREHRKMSGTEKQTKIKCNWFGYEPLSFLENGPEGENEGNSIYDSAGVSVKSDMLDNSVDGDEMDYCNSLDSQSQSAINPIDTSIVKKEPTELGTSTLECMKTLIDVVAKRDEFSIYGDYIAEKLRSCARSKLELHIAQHHIDNVIFNLIMGVYSREATSTAVEHVDTSSEFPNVALKEEKM